MDPVPREDKERHDMTRKDKRRVYMDTLIQRWANATNRTKHFTSNLGSNS